MAKIQFGQSFCQIEGKFVPVADFNLAATDSVYFAHHLLLWKDDSVHISAMSLKKGWKRLMAGLPLVMTQATGPGHVAFSKDLPGELFAVPLQAGQSIDVREHVFMIATGKVLYDWFQTDIWFTARRGNDTETFYPIGMFMDRFSVGAEPGLLLLYGSGNIFVRQLEPGQTILIKPTALLFKEPSVRMNLHFEHPATAWRLWGSVTQRYTWLRLHGPGRVAVQSHFEPLEDPGTQLSRTCASTTQQRW